MGFQIESGDHHSYNAKVSSDGRLLTDSVSFPELSSASVNGKAFYAASGFIPLITTGSFNGIFTLKNTSTSQHLHIVNIRTCGTSIQQWELYKSATTGTLFTAGNIITPNNLNFSSAISFSGTATNGADGLTVTNGTTMGQHVNDIGHSNVLFDGSLILNTNDSITLACKPSASSDVCATVLMFFR